MGAPAARRPSGVGSCRPDASPPRRFSVTRFSRYMMVMDIDQIISDFEFLDDWEDRYRYIIELGRKLPPLPDA